MILVGWLVGWNTCRVLWDRFIRRYLHGLLPLTRMDFLSVIVEIYFQISKYLFENVSG
jgi:hypothetical protein